MLFTKEGAIFSFPLLFTESTSIFDYIEGVIIEMFIFLSCLPYLLSSETMAE